jgi:hypothetical protein
VVKVFGAYSEMKNCRPSEDGVGLVGHEARLPEVLAVAVLELADPAYRVAVEDPARGPLVLARLPASHGLNDLGL